MVRKTLYSLIVFWVLTSIAFILPNQASAQISDIWNNIVGGCVQDVYDTAGNVIGNDVATLSCIPAIFRNVVFAAFLFAGVVALFFIVYAGIRFITSRGDPKAVEGAKQTLTWAIIGLIVIILSFTIINLIADFTGAGQCITVFGIFTPGICV